MPLDFDLVRLILLEIEKKPANSQPDTVQVAGFDEDTVTEHLELLEQRGLITANFIRAGSGERRIYVAWVTGLTWAGHEFLGNARNETIWSQAKAVVKERGTSVSLEIFTSLLAQIAAKLFGLG